MPCAEAKALLLLSIRTGVVKTALRSSHSRWVPDIRGLGAHAEGVHGAQACSVQVVAVLP